LLEYILYTQLYFSRFLLMRAYENEREGASVTLDLAFSARAPCVLFANSGNTSAHRGCPFEICT
jgi:hypothetical protein